MFYYQLNLYLAITLSGIFLWKWNRYISVSYSVVFLLIPFINLGYFRLAVAETYTEAILANGLCYLCASFLQLGMTAYIFSFCKLKMPKLVSMPLFITNSVIGSIALTTNRNHLLYTESELVVENGLSRLHKVYGPIHTVFYIMIICYMLMGIGVLIYGFTRKDVSKKNTVILAVLYLINVISFFGSRIFHTSVELQPATYSLSQTIMLILSERLRMYSISEMAVDNITKEGKTGFASFDQNRHYLGCTGPALKYLPELAELYIDGPLHRGDPKFDMIQKWFDITDLNHKTSEFNIERDNTSYYVTVNHIMSGNKIKGYQISIDDNTDEARYIRLLQEARQSAETVSQAKGDFLAHMSHEIRTPINAILGMDEMILRESNDEQTLEYAEDIKKAGNTLLGLINDILDFSKIEAGKTELIPVDYQLSSVLNDLSNIIEPRANEKGLSFSVKVDPSTPDCLHGDEIRIKQIIMNLLTNAVKYTKEGTVTLAVEHERDGEDMFLRVSVQDTGIGIKQEDIDKLFIAFERIEEDRNRSIEGTGLGITITQQLLALMDSRLEVKSVYGEGSVFYFTIKQHIVKDSPIGDYSAALERSADARRSYHESFVAPDAKVLVVDDTEMNLVVFVNLLKKTKMQIDPAMSGDEAIAMAHNKKYDLIFLDHRMPNKDGIQTLAEIKADEEGLNRDTPVISLTANAISGMREKYIAAGFVEYLTKPIDPVRLESMIVELLPDELILPAEDDGKTAEDDGGEAAELLEIYLGNVKTMSNEIETLYENEDWTNYTIKVHALKSTSRLVGEYQISSLAEQLEKAGDSGDIPFIRDNTYPLLEMYRAVPEKYGRSLEEAVSDEDKPEATEEMMTDAYADMHAAVKAYDYDALCSVLDELNDYAVPETQKQKLADITAAADRVDWGALNQLLS